MGTINASGSDASSESGTVAYSIGQVFYSYVGLSIYNVAQGVQHDNTINTLIVEENLEPTAEIIIFPNPTTDYVTVNMNGLELEQGIKSYQMYDLQGRMVKQNTISQTETPINMTDLSASVYILQVVVNSELLKTFKIVKN
ncbi:T9SS type A sorting domain-containing protein [Flavobacterium algicola]|uniref:T9SS type A sorting domain-containing protein n=1 Tax=Flavobacterium algicola TaxID=556529 RepID=UPI001EFC6522|nr:T9SS type A sorting domain-containing protein [Flavobacterium algicola]MCG9793504.1 T9SS type A sorting domain-containing protein [Flavobacterium algicola]